MKLYKIMLEYLKERYTKSRDTIKHYLLFHQHIVIFLSVEGDINFQNCAIYSSAVVIDR